MDSYAELQRRTMRLKSQNRTWEDVGESIGVSGAMAWKIANGKGDSNVARHHFQLPPRVVEVPPCAACGEVHTLKRCNKKQRRHRDRLASSLAPEEARAVRDELGGMSVTDFWRDWLRRRNKYTAPE